MQVLVATKTRFQIFHIAALRFYESDVVQVLTPPARASHAYALPLLSYLHMRVCPRSTVRLCMRMRVYGHVCMYACMHACMQVNIDKDEGEVLRRSMCARDRAGGRDGKEGRRRQRWRVG